MKQIIENTPDLEAAFEAVKGVLFGPLDPALVKLKHKEIIIEAKEKRGQEFFTLGGRSASSDDLAERGRKDRDTHTRTLTWLLANDRAYAKVYNDTMGALGDAERDADDALEKLEAAHTKARRDIQVMLDRAAKLPDGRRAFKDKNGQVWDEHGAQVSDDQAASIEWRSNEPTYEVFSDQSRYADDISRSVNEMRGVQVDLGEIREEMTDQKNPPTQERAEDLREQVQELDRKTQENVARIRAEAMQKPEVQTYTPTATMPLPPG